MAGPLDALLALTQRLMPKAPPALPAAAPPPAQAVVVQVPPPASLDSILANLMGAIDGFKAGQADLPVYPDRLRVTVYDAEWLNDQTIMDEAGNAINLFPSEFSMLIPYPSQGSGWSEVRNIIQDAITQVYPTGQLASWRWTMRNR